MYGPIQMLHSNSKSQDKRLKTQGVPFLPSGLGPISPDKLVTRIAPSPTGDMHLGTARTAYFNWLAARATGGKFILRIDDTDPERSKPEFTNVILETMEWLGLTADLVFYQSRRYALYGEILRLLREEGNDIREKDGAIWLHEHNMPESWVDELAGTIKISQNDRDYLSQNGLVIFRKPDESGIRHPTYHFASVCDDVLFGVNCIIRGVDHTANVPKQLAIYTAMKQPLPKFYHIGLIKKDGKKLSKRDGAASMLAYREQGVSPEAMLNFMGRIGWGPRKDDASTSILTRDDMLRLFWEGGKMRGSDAGMDLAKLAWYDKQYKAMQIRTQQVTVTGVEANDRNGHVALTVR